MTWEGGLSEAVGGAEWSQTPAPQERSSLESRGDGRTGLWSSSSDSGGLIGPHPVAFVDVEWPVVRL